MDPLSITTGCLSLVDTIGKVTVAINSFVRKARDARKDLDSVLRELGSLYIVLDLLAEDTQAASRAIPVNLEKQISGIVNNCSAVVDDVDKSIKRHESGKLNSVRWAWSGKEEMGQLRSLLEAHKTSLELALDMVAISMTREIKNDTTEIKATNEAIKNDTSQILAEIARLQAELAPAEEAAQKSSVMLQRYLDELTSYAESVVGETQDSRVSSDGEESISSNRVDVESPPQESLPHEATAVDEPPDEEQFAAANRVDLEVIDDKDPAVLNAVSLPDESYFEMPMHVPGRKTQMPDENTKQLPPIPEEPIAPWTLYFQDYRNDAARADDGDMSEDNATEAGPSLIKTSSSLGNSTSDDVQSISPNFAYPAIDKENSALVDVVPLQTSDTQAAREDLLDQQPVDNDTPLSEWFTMPSRNTQTRDGYNPTNAHILRKHDLGSADDPASRLIQHRAPSRLKKSGSVPRIEAPTSFTTSITQEFMEAIRTPSASARSVGSTTVDSILKISPADRFRKMDIKNIDEGYKLLHYSSNWTKPYASVDIPVAIGANRKDKPECSYARVSALNRTISEAFMHGFSLRPSLYAIPRQIETLIFVNISNIFNAGAFRRVLYIICSCQYQYRKQQQRIICFYYSGNNEDLYPRPDIMRVFKDIGVLPKLMEPLRLSLSTKCLISECTSSFSPLRSLSGDATTLEVQIMICFAHNKHQNTLQTECDWIDCVTRSLSPSNSVVIEGLDDTNYLKITLSYLLDI